jgi:hypothetical protein
MWKISVVMLVTTAFAGLLIYNPYELSAKNAAAPTDAPSRPVNEVQAPVQVATAPASETTTKPQDTHVIVLKLVGDRVVAQDVSDIVGSLPDKPLAAIAARPLPVSAESQERPVLQIADQTAVGRPVSRRREDTPVAGVDAALPDQPAPTVAPQPLPASNVVQERPVLQTAAQTPVLHPVLGRREEPTASRVDGTAADKPVVATNPPRPAPVSNGLQERPALQTAAQTPVVHAVLGRREEPTVSNLDVAIPTDGTCTSGKVIGLDPNGDNFLSVRSGPGGQPYREIDRLFTSDTVYVCGRKAPWLAVVYSQGHKAQASCDTASKGTRRSNEAQCQYGWVHSRYIKTTTTENAKVAVADNGRGW